MYLMDNKRTMYDIVAKFQGGGIFKVFTEDSKLFSKL